MYVHKVECGRIKMVVKFIFCAHLMAKPFIKGGFGHVATALIAIMIHHPNSKSQQVSVTRLLWAINCVEFKDVGFIWHIIGSVSWLHVDCRCLANKVVIGWRVKLITGH